MRLIYNLGILLYHAGIRIASLFDRKARLWIRGRKGWKGSLQKGIDPDTEYIWFHCASLGEFEQGRPVIEAIRRKHPQQKILLTFFSPSGLEIRKNYPGADHVHYLPLDTAKNARIFMDTVQIKTAYFVKYEFWYHFLRELDRRAIPAYLISAVFRSGQVFFRAYGRWFREILKSFDRIFLQDEESGKCLSGHGILNFTVSGDTRFDRVREISQNAREVREAGSFAGSSPVFVAGSTWPPDEELICRFIKESDHDLKYILVPHEIHSEHIKKLRNRLGSEAMVFSSFEEGKAAGARILIIDTMGMLSSLYRYGSLAYIGGGFGKGIHNILEAAAFGIPVIFGPRYHKFREAHELIDMGAGHSIHDFTSFRAILDRFFSESELLKTKGIAAEKYVKSRTGATSVIVNSTLKN